MSPPLADPSAPADRAEPRPPRVRPAVPGDAAALAALRYAFRAALAPPTESERAFVARCGGWMAARLAGGGTWHAWVAEGPGTLLGNVWLQQVEKVPNPVDEGELHAYLTNLYVTPAARGGVGSRLLAAALAHADASGVDTTYLWPTAPSRRLYARFGFEGAGPVMLRPRPAAR